VAISIVESIATAVDTPSGSATSASWTPGSNDLLLCLIAIRAGGAGAASTWISGVSGNGLTWVKVAEIDDTQNTVALSVWRAMGASPSSGGVTVTFATNPISVNFQIVRLSGTDTTGSNGSGAIGATATAETGATDSTPATTSITTTAPNSRVIGFASGRGQTYTVGSGFTSILINQTVNAGGSVSRSNSEYKDVASSGTNTTVDFSLASAGDWCIAAIEVLEPGNTTYNSNVSGNITPAGGTAKVMGKSIAGAITTAGIMLKLVLRTLAGTVTSSGAAAKQARKTLTGVVTSVAALVAVRSTIKALTGSIGSSGTLMRSLARALIATITSVGALVKQAIKRLSGVVTLSGALITIRIFLKALSGAVTLSGAVVRNVAKLTTGTVTSAGTIAKRLAPAHLSSSEPSLRH
jgi:hypothetical protein